MTRVSLTALAGAAALAAGLFAATVPAQARCASAISCAQQPNGAIAKGGGIAGRPGVGGVGRPGMMNPGMGGGAGIVAAGGGNIVAAGGGNFRPR